MLYKISNRLRGAFEKRGKTYPKSIYTIESIDNLALILKDSIGHIIDKRVKPYNVKLANGVETAPNNKDIEQHSNKDNKKLNQFVNKEKR